MLDYFLGPLYITIRWFSRRAAVTQFLWYYRITIVNTTTLLSYPVRLYCTASRQTGYRLRIDCAALNLYVMYMIVLRAIAWCVYGKHDSQCGRIVNPLQCRPAPGPGEVRVSGSGRVRPDDAEGSRIERQTERTMCPEVSSGNGETKSTSTVRRRGLWDEDETIGHSTERGEGRRSSEIRSENPRRRRSPDCEASSGPNSQYHTAATERVETRRTPSCRKDRWSNTALKGTKSSGNKENEKEKREFGSMVNRRQWIRRVCRSA